MARKFRFRLETVRKLRERARDAQRQVVSERVRAVGAVERRLSGFAGDLEAAVDGSRDASGTGRLDMASLRSHRVYRAWLHRKMDDTRVELDGRRRELSTEQERLADATRRLRVIEKLREKQWTRYCSELAREEQTANDEVALQVYQREAGRQRTIMT